MDQESYKLFDFIWQDISALSRIEVLKQAIQLNLFEQLNDWTSVEAINTDLTTEQVEFFLLLLWSMTILERSLINDTHHYKVSSNYLPYVSLASDDYFLDSILNRIKSFEANKSMINTWVGDSVAEEIADKSWAYAGRKHLYQDQKVLISPLAKKVLLPYLTNSARRFKLLDLGGNPGNVAIDLVKHYANLTAVIVDLPETASVIQENIVRHQLQDRISQICGIFPEMDIGQDYDFIWCAQLFYFIDDVELGLQKITQALSKNGILFFAHVELPEARKHMTSILPWYMKMYLNHQNIFKQGEWSKRLLAQGFTIIADDYVNGFPVCPLKLIIASKK